MLQRFIGRAIVIMLAWVAGTAPSAAQEIYVPNYLDGDVSVLDARTLATLARIPVTATADPSIAVTGLPSAVEFSLDHRFAFVVISDSDRVAVIDTHQRIVVQYIVISPVTFDALIFRHPDGQRLYVTSCADPVISVIDIASRSTVATIPLPDGGYALAFSRDGSTGYVASGYPGCGAVPGLYRLNLVTHTLSGFIALSQAPSDVAVAPSGLFALTTGGNRILVVNLATNTETGSVKCGLLPCLYTATGATVFNASGTRAYSVDSETNDFITINTDPKSRGFLQELSRVRIAAPAGTTFWQVAVHKNRAYVASLAWNAPAAVVELDISRDLAALVGSEQVGAFAYELNIWTYPASKQECDGEGWKRFGLFEKRGECISSVVNNTGSIW
jgi:YVTN family beta-propeller protein